MTSHRSTNAEAVQAASPRVLPVERSDRRLHECKLPEGVRLTHPQPVQRRMFGLLVWSFELAFEDAKLGTITHIERYEQQVADAVQMAWALRSLHAKARMMGADVPAESWAGKKSQSYARVGKARIPAREKSAAVVAAERYLRSA